MWFKLTKLIINDLKFWLAFSKMIRTVQMEDIIKTPSIELIGASDASDVGGGFVIGNEWSYYRFNFRHRVQWSIA